MFSNDASIAWRAIAFAASAGAAGIHFAAARPHLDEYAPAGAFMFLAGLAQLVWAVWVAAGAPRAVVAAGTLNAAVVALWVVSRTAGLPVGLEPGMPEHVHGADLIASVLEVLVVIAAVALASGSSRRPDPVLWLLVAAAVGGSVLASADEPARDRFVAAATLALAAAVRALIASVRSPRPVGGSHVQVTFVRPLLPRRRVAAGAGVGARR